MLFRTKNLAKTLSSVALLSLCVVPVLGVASAKTAKPAAPADAAAAPASNPAPLTREQFIAKLQTQFQSLDTNKDGYVTQAELAAGLAAEQTRVLAQLRQQREAAFNAMDTNKDGVLSREEFMAAGPRANGPAPDGSKIMEKLDANKDGYLTFAEYTALALQAFDRNAAAQQNANAGGAQGR